MAARPGNSDRGILARLAKKIRAARNFKTHPSTAPSFPPPLPNPMFSCFVSLIFGPGPFDSKNHSPNHAGLAPSSPRARAASPPVKAIDEYEALHKGGTTDPRKRKAISVDPIHNSRQTDRVVTLSKAAQRNPLPEMVSILVGGSGNCEPKRPKRWPAPGLWRHAPATCSSCCSKT